MKTALTISGSDSSGGAGIQGDLKVFSILGVSAMTVLTAVTAQNTLGIHESLAIEPELVRKQIDSVAGDVQVDVCKTGMLVNAKIVETVIDAIGRNKLQPYVCDPVLMSKSGATLLEAEAVALLRTRLAPLATIVTPNRAELAALLDMEARGIESIANVKEAARKLAGKGVRAVVVTGVPSDDQTVDLLFDGSEFYEFAGKTQPAEKTHGAGDAFSAAIAAGLANRLPLVDAIDQAKQLVNMAIQYSDGQGRGLAAVNALAFKPKVK